MRNLDGDPYICPYFESSHSKQPFHMHSPHPNFESAKQEGAPYSRASGKLQGSHPFNHHDTECDQLEDIQSNTGKVDTGRSNTVSEKSRWPSCQSVIKLSIVERREQCRSTYLVNAGSSCSLLGPRELDGHLPGRKLSVFCCTWNMADCQVPEQLVDVLLPADPAAGESMSDIYAVGSQESPVSQLWQWDVTLQRTLGPTHVLLTSVTYGQLHLALFIRRDLSFFCSVPDKDCVSTRSFSAFKTKGAIGLCFMLFGTSFLFITSHLTSNEGKYADRRADYETIVSKLRLPRLPLHLDPRSLRYLRTSHNSPDRDVTSVFDVVLWLGDLNFRLDRGPRTKASVEAQIDHHLQGDVPTDFDVVMEADELRKGMSHNEIFKGFHEPRISFPPTYKYDIGTDNFDTSKKERIPAYTDRILYRSKKHKKWTIRCDHYASVPSVKVSDHKPVVAVFQVAVRPGKDHGLQLAAGQFSRDVFLEATKQRCGVTQPPSPPAAERSTAQSTSSTPAATSAAAAPHESVSWPASSRPTSCPLTGAHSSGPTTSNTGPSIANHSDNPSSKRIVSVASAKVAADRARERNPGGEHNSTVCTMT